MTRTSRNVRFIPESGHGRLLNHVIGTSPCGLKIDHKFERRWLHDGKVGGLVTLKNSARVDPRLSVCIGEIRPIASHTTGGSKFTEWIDGWHPKIRCQSYNLLTLDRKKRIAADQKPLGV